MRYVDNSKNIYCTWVHREVLPQDLRRKFKDLDHFIRSLLSSASESILIIAPYLTVDGINLVKDSLFASAEAGAWIKIVTGGLAEPKSQNRRALIELTTGDRGEKIRSRLRIVEGKGDLDILLHSKIIVIDTKMGYLGSANITFSAFEKNFEVGVALSRNQAISIERLVSYWESTALLCDCTKEVLIESRLRDLPD